MKLDKELMLLNVALLYPDVWDSDVEALDYLPIIDNPHIKNIFLFIREFLEKNGAHPKIQDIIIHFSDDPTYGELIQQARELEITPQHAVEILELELKKRALLRLTSTILPLISEPDVDIEGLWEAGREALRIHRKAKDIGIDYLLSDPTYLNSEREDYYIKTLTDIDTRLPMHGFRKQWVCLIVGGPGFGKSLLLQNFALAALLEQRSVLYVTLEMLEDEVMSRLDIMLLSTILPMPKNANEPFFVSLGDVRQKLGSLMQLKDALRRHVSDAFFKIVYFPPQELSPMSLERLIDRMEIVYNQKVDLVVIDYADLMRANRPRESKWEETADIFQSLKRVAVRKEVLIMTGTQIGKKGMYKQLTTQADIYGSSEKSFNVDYILNIQKDKLEVMENVNRFRLIFSKARFGANSFMPVHLEPKGLLLIPSETIIERLSPYLSEEFLSLLDVSVFQHSQTRHLEDVGQVGSLPDFRQFSKEPEEDEYSDNDYHDGGDDFLPF